RASVGLNIAMDYLPGSVTLDPAAGDQPSPQLASRAVWFDALITNIDRTARNPNLLMWHRQLYLIDHGAALYFHHQWEWLDEKALSPFSAIRQHVLLPWASQLPEADEALRPMLTSALLKEILGLIPEAWLSRVGVDASADEIRAAYLAYFEQRLAASSIFLAEAQRAHAQLV
ncbi:MAG: aminotransferase class I and II, partial [Acidobacteria bacterium]|nr:aminotransferase class I and II [Acidobacteriota bacterium]